MKTYLKFPLYLALGAMMGMNLAACSDDDEPEVETGLTAQEEALKAVVSDFADKTVIPTYQGMADAAMQLHGLCIDIRSKKQAGTLTTADVEAACQAWKLARDYWEKSEAFLWGAATDFGIDPHIDTWPLDLTGLKEALTNTAQIAGLAGEDGDVYAGEKLGPTLLGFHGIEYVLFWEGEHRNVSWFEGIDAGVKCADYLTYAVAVAGDLRNKCWQMELAWAGEEHNPDRFAKVNDELELPLTPSGGLYYGENLLSAGRAGSSCRSATVAMQWMIEGCNTIADEVASQKIGMVYTGGDPNYVESPYSYKSIVDFEDNIISIKNVWNGGIEGDYDAVNSLSAYFKEVNPDLEKQISDAIEDAIAKIRLIPEPFIENYGNDSAGAAIGSIQTLDNYLSQAVNVLAE